jgi:hypothetical protein
MSGHDTVALVKMSKPVQNFDMRARTRPGRRIWPL